ncbi:MAG: hypothetical protein SGARI_006188 [Bacillariaceae sp.]
MQLLLLVYPQAALTHDYEGLTPLHRLWVREYVLLGGDALKQVHSEQDLTGELAQAWQKTTMLLYAMQFGTLKQVEGKTFRPLHAMASLDCPRRVLRMGAQIYKAQLLEMDEDGNTPLLLACAAPVYKFRDIGYDGTDLEDKLEDHLYEEIENSMQGTAANLKDDTLDEDKMSVSSDNSAPSKLPSVVEILMNASPEAATVNAKDGRTPLQVAQQSGKTYHQGIGALTGNNSLEQKMQAASLNH